MTRADEGIGIRAARAEDAAAIARIHVESWQATYAGILPDEILLGLDSRQHEARWWRHVLGRFRRNHEVYVAVQGEGEIVGFASGGPSRERDLPYGGELYTLYLQDDYHGRGIGRDLFESAIAGICETRGPSVIVWCLSANPSRFFYEHMGGALVARRPSRVGAARVEEVGYGWSEAPAPVGRESR
ncbi:MAG: GNAT family N-acetyltransferase [Rhodospirillaceae bacterium]